MEAVYIKPPTKEAGDSDPSSDLDLNFNLGDTKVEDLNLTSAIFATLEEIILVALDLIGLMD